MSDQNTSQIRSLGEFLRAHREKKNLVLEQVASATKISLRTLHAIESDQYADLPAKPFVRGFIASYAKFIGLDEKEVLLQFDTFIDDQCRKRPDRESSLSGYAFERRDTDRGRLALWIVMSTFLIIGGLLMIFLKPKLKHHKKSVAEKMMSSASLANSSLELNSGESLPNSAFSNLSGSNLSGSNSSGSPELSASPSAVSSSIISKLSASTSSSSASSSKHSSSAKSASSKSTSSKSASVSKSANSIQSPSPAPSSTPTPNPTSSPSLDSTRKPDPLLSGADLLPNEVKHKIVFKALGDLWVRYKIDDKESKRIVLRTDKVLVLKAKEKISFQVHDPDLISFIHNGSASRVASEVRGLKKFRGSATLFFPESISKDATDPFPESVPLTPSNPPPPPYRPEGEQ